MRAWTNRTELPSGRRFDNATSNRSEVALEHDKRIIAQVTGLMHGRLAGPHEPGEKLPPPTLQGLALFSRPRSVFSIVFQQYSRELGTRQAPAAAVLSVPSQHERDLPRLTTCTGNCGR